MKNQTLAILIGAVSLIIFVPFVGCKKEETKINLSSFEGTWINEKTLSDTMVVNTTSTFILNRAKRMTSDGSLLPDFGSGIYGYRIDDDSIFLNWMFSSNSASKEYLLNLENGRLSIGNFYEPMPQSEPTVTFKKIK